MYGWGEPDVYGQPDPMGYYAEDPYLAEETSMARPIPTATTGKLPRCPAGVSRRWQVTRDVPPAFNAGCPAPNVSGFGETAHWRDICNPVR